MAVDLHIHSTASDGSLTPGEVIEAACRLKLTAVAIADHDTIDGLPEARQAAEGCILFIPALETSAVLGYGELHILGYYPDESCPALLEALRHIRQERVLRGRRMVEKLQALDVKIGYEDVERAANDATVGRPHIANALVQVGAVRTPLEAFERYLRRGRPAYVDRYRLEPREAIRLIREAGGLPVLAHPGLVKHDDVIPELVAAGLGGLEVWHVNHSRADVDRYLALARQQGLVATGGSDSHGPGGSQPVKIGAVHVPDSCAEELQAWREQSR